MNAQKQKGQVGEKYQQNAAFQSQSNAENTFDQIANSSPQVKQLQSMAEIANRSAYVDNLTQLHSLANASGGEGSLGSMAKNETGLPDRLKSGIESLGGYSMDDVRVHYNSSKPAQLQAHAYAQGTDIHIAPGQEKHLAHEAWHVVQQKQGRVKPTLQMKGIAINDDSGLEKEADVMGEKALGLGGGGGLGSLLMGANLVSDVGAIQRVKVKDSGTGDEIDTDLLMADKKYEELYALALRFYQIHNEEALALIQEAHRAELKDLGYDISTEAFTILSASTSSASSSSKKNPVEEQSRDEDSKVDPSKDEEDLQPWLTDDYWKDRLFKELGAKAGQEAFLRVKGPKFWTGPQKRDKAKKEPARRLETIIDMAPAILGKLAEVGKTSKSRLRIYRGMNTEEASKILKMFGERSSLVEAQLLGGTMKPADLRKQDGLLLINGHLGDKAQANKYAQGNDSVLLEFVLKPGAHLLLFSQELMALAPAGKGTGAFLVELFGDFRMGTQNEGNLTGYVGLKSEVKGDFSFTVMNDATRLLFQLLVETINVVEVTRE